VKDASNYILTELNTLLNGTVTYLGSPVNYYALNEDPADNESLFISVGSAYVLDDLGTKDMFIRPYTVNLDIVNRVNSLSEKAVNEISSTIGGLVWPSKNTLGVNATAYFETIKVQISSRTSPENKYNGLWHIRKILELEFTIKQL
jgi:hypothetical protein